MSTDIKAKIGENGHLEYAGGNAPAKEAPANTEVETPDQVKTKDTPKEPETTVPETDATLPEEPSAPEAPTGDEGLA